MILILSHFLLNTNGVCHSSRIDASGRSRDQIMTFLDTCMFVCGKNILQKVHFWINGLFIYRPSPFYIPSIDNKALIPFVLCKLLVIQIKSFIIGYLNDFAVTRTPIKGAKSPFGTKNGMKSYQWLFDSVGSVKYSPKLNDILSNAIKQLSKCFISIRFHPFSGSHTYTQNGVIFILQCNYYSDKYIYFVLCGWKSFYRALWFCTFWTISCSLLRILKQLKKHQKNQVKPR